MDSNVPIVPVLFSPPHLVLHSSTNTMHYCSIPSSLLMFLLLSLSPGVSLASPTSTSSSSQPVSEHYMSWNIAFGFVCVFVLSVVASLVYMVIADFRSQKASASFFREAELHYGYHVPDEEIAAYEVAKTSAKLKLDPEDPTGGEDDMEDEDEEEEEDEFVEPSESWLRRIGIDERKQLKGLLLKRAIANIPRWDQIGRDVDGKFRLYKRRIISERHWQTVDDAQRDLKLELEYLKYQAECLEAKWGEDVLRNAITIYKYNQEKEAAKRKTETDQNMKEKALRQQQKLTEHQLLIEQQQKEKQQRIANKMAEALIREEHSAGRKSSSRQLQKPKEG
eukprot:GHVS01091026.1.p1 GENE.GHVS01091026.1~~GHVS01091026.1.p1  ORF type:complete len:336 (+),score=76.54 GHVS01091026.1:130-1137(+)